MTKRALKGPGGKGGLKNVKLFLKNRAEFMVNMWETHGDCCHFRLGILDVVLLNDPELINEILMDDEKFPKSAAYDFMKRIIGNGILTSSGKFHRRQRRMMAPAFQPKRIRSYYTAMKEAIDGSIDSWSDEQEIDIYNEMGILALNTVSKTLFNTDADDTIPDRVANALNHIIRIGDRIAQPTGMLKMLLPLPSNIRFLQARKDLDKIIYGLIDEHRKTGGDQGDLLSMLLAAQDDDDGTTMTDKQVRDEAITLYIAGHETTAICLNWTWYALSQNPEVKAKLYKELDEVLGDSEPTMENLPELVYTRRLLMESMRLYPPVVFFDRQPAEDWDTGSFIVPRKTFTFLCPYTMHRHPDYFPDPMKFDPDRWTSEFTASLPKGAYFPFGGGPRICIGEHFAWAELTLAVVTIAQRWDMELSPGQTIGISPTLTLRPKTGIKMKLKARERKTTAV